ncbi:MAG: hypothetical protein HY017_06195 [Betaproteobacteria bacterium]|nr:hypothetical protein [Betaproteobacteria bacterium]
MDRRRSAFRTFFLGLALSSVVIGLGAAAASDVAKSGSPVSRLLEFSDVERRKILSHGPWPPVLAPDPSNRVSGRPEAIAFGEKLFFEPRLSGTGSVLCASCHAPFRGWHDGRPRAFGLEQVERNTPSLLNVRFSRRFGWDGGHDSLWSQSVRPLLDPREMRSSAAHVAGFVRSNPSVKESYEQAFQRSPPQDDEELLVDVGKALAAFQETLVTGRTPFDAFQDALDRGDRTAAARYPLSAQRGLRIFIGKAGCGACHSGPTFTNGGFANVGTGPDAKEWRVPGLREVARTAPYMHDGQLASLRDVVNRHPKPLSLSASESNDLLEFLESLTAF